MSTVAIKIEDGYAIMAGDRQVAQDCWGKHGLTKVWRIRDELVGIVGEIGRGMRAVQWYMDGGHESEFPTDQLKDGNFVLIVWDGTDILTIDEQGFRVPIEEMSAAVGSGAMAARGAMEMGASAQRAVEVASLIDEHSGQGQDVVRVAL